MIFSFRPVHDAAMFSCFWSGYLIGLVRGLTPVLVHKLPFVS